VCKTTAFPLGEGTKSRAGHDSGLGSEGLINPIFRLWTLQPEDTQLVLTLPA
jgi:hypothetical protein